MNNAQRVYDGHLTFPMVWSCEKIYIKSFFFSELPNVHQIIMRTKYCTWEEVCHKRSMQNCSIVSQEDTDKQSTKAILTIYKPIIPRFKYTHFPKYSNDQIALWNNFETIYTVPHPKPAFPHSPKLAPKAKFTDLFRVPTVHEKRKPNSRKQKLPIQLRSSTHTLSARIIPLCQRRGGFATPQRAARCAQCMPPLWLPPSAVYPGNVQGRPSALQQLDILRAVPCACTIEGKKFRKRTTRHTFTCGLWRRRLFSSITSSIGRRWECVGVTMYEREFCGNSRYPAMWGKRSVAAGDNWAAGAFFFLRRMYRYRANMSGNCSDLKFVGCVEPSWLFCSHDAVDLAVDWGNY